MKTITIISLYSIIIFSCASNVPPDSNDLTLGTVQSKIFKGQSQSHVMDVLGSHNIVNNIWDLLIENDVEPCGRAVRDVLRIEMKYCLYGNDIDETISPIEASLNLSLIHI